MVVKVFLKRKVRQEDQLKLTPLLIELRNGAMRQPGYISGQTLISMDEPNQYIVISSWNTREDWNNWFNSIERLELQRKVDDILHEPTTYDVYWHGT